MRHLLILVCSIVLAGWTLPLHGQDEAPATVYNVVDYMHVSPAMQDDYLALEAAWKKIHVANVKAGKYEGWQMSRILLPAGSEQAYNFVTRTRFRGDAQFANHLENYAFPENWESLMTKEEIALMERTSEIRTWVKTDVFVVAETYMSENAGDATINVFNFFTHPPGKDRADHFDTERKYWLPIHQQRIDDGMMKGWAMAAKILPYSETAPYADATVDMYTNLEEMLAGSSKFMEYFEAAHPDADPEEVFRITEENMTLIRAEIRQVVDEYWKE